MPRSKVSYLEEMTIIGKEIIGRLIFEKIKIKPTHLDVPVTSNRLKMTFIQEGHVWLLAIYRTEYAEVVRILGLQKPEIWARYKVWGDFDECREMVLLKEALVKLRSALVSRKRPDYYKKRTHDYSKNKTKARPKAKNPS